MYRSIIFLLLALTLCKTSPAQAVPRLANGYQSLLEYNHLWYSHHILFICGGNTGRSPLAENLANDYYDFPKSGYIAFSRGVNVNPQERMPERNAVTVMRQWNPLSRISMHRATSVTAMDISKSTIILTMTQAQKEKLRKLYPKAMNKIWMLSECANGIESDVNDMYGHDLDFYQQTSKKIADYIQLIQEHTFSCREDITPTK